MITSMTSHCCKRLLRLVPMANPHEGISMNRDRIEGNWKQLKGSALQQWGRITDDQRNVIAGKRDQLAGKIQEAYGVTKEKAEKQLNDWQNSQK
jgi:uncharacterized protein YjbJ (UPF0337 family)